MEQITEAEKKVITLTGTPSKKYHNLEKPCWNLDKAGKDRWKKVPKSQAEKFYEKCGWCDWEE